jgi:hypothetical protein
MKLAVLALIWTLLAAGAASAQKNLLYGYVE